MSVTNKEIDTKFQELFAQNSSDITFDEYINFGVETITSENTSRLAARMPRKKYCRGLGIRRYCFNQ